MKVLVTGAGGFLGGHIVARLDDVRGLDLRWPDGPETCDRITGSVLDPDTVAKAVHGVDVVIHAAAISDLWSSGRFDYDRVNVLGTCRVLAAARRAGARTVLVSSYTTLVDRRTAPGSVLDESVELWPTRLTGPYPRSKRQAELAALSAVAAGQEVVIVLPTAPVGAGDYRPTPPGRLIRDLATGRLPALLDARLNLVDARSVAEAIVTAAKTGRSGRRYLLAGEDISTGELARRVAALSGVPAPTRRVPLSLARAFARAEEAVARVTGRMPRAPLTGIRLAALDCRFDAARASDELGFVPRPVDEALALAVAEFRAGSV